MNFELWRGRIQMCWHFGLVFITFPPLCVCRILYFGNTFYIINFGYSICQRYFVIEYLAKLSISFKVFVRYISLMDVASKFEITSYNNLLMSHSGDCLGCCGVLCPFGVHLIPIVTWRKRKSADSIPWHKPLFRQLIHTTINGLYKNVNKNVRLHKNYGPT